MRNIVLISIDCLRSDALGCCINKPSLTPNINRLAREGLFFPNTIVQAPYTVSSHASMLTGYYPFNHGLRQQFSVSKIHPSSLHLLKELGKDYDLLSFVGANLFDEKYGYKIWDYQGKSKLWSIQRNLPSNSRRPFFAFIHYFGAHTPYKLRLSENLWESLGEHLEDLVKNDYLHIPKLGGLHNRLFGGDSRKIRKIRENISRGSEGFLEKVKNGYRKGVMYADNFVGKVIEILSSKGLLQETIVVVTGDHGESFNEFNEIQSFPNDYEHGPFLYDTVIKVPLIICDPRLPSGQVINQQVQSIDILPTLFDIIGRDKDKNVNGRSLVPYISSKKMEKDNYLHAYSETMKDSKTSDEPKVKKVCIRSSHGYKLIIDYKNSSERLVDYRKDEAEDIKKDRPKIYKELKRALQRLISNERRTVREDSEQICADDQEEIVQRLRGLGYLE